jgi:mannitol/fructose-specific phosphotransferase system IIA component (Ntr-type)
MRFSDLFEEQSVICGLRSDDRDECFRELLTQLVETRRISKELSDTALEAILKRERIGSTGIGSGVAIPHVKIPEVRQIVATVGIHHNGIEFRAIDGEPVHIVFLIIRPADEANEHLKFLQWISRLARNADFRRFMSTANSRSEMVSLLHEMHEV